MNQSSTCIGQTIVIKGQLISSEDIAIEGRVEGKVELREHVLTIAPTGEVSAELAAKTIIVSGTVHGDIFGVQKVDIQKTGQVDGDISAPRIAMSDGARFQGKVTTVRVEASS